MRSTRTDYSFWERPGPDRTRAKCLLGLELGRQVCALGGHGGTDYPHVRGARSLWVWGGGGGPRARPPAEHLLQQEMGGGRTVLSPRPSSALAASGRPSCCCPEATSGPKALDGR